MQENGFQLADLAGYGTYGYNGFDAISLFGVPDSARQTFKNFLELNKRDFQIEMRDAERIFCSRFQWSGKDIEHLPNGYIERNLFMGGRLVCFPDPDVGFCMLRGTPCGLNYFFEPAGFTIIANGWHKNVMIEDCIDLRENPSAVPPVWEIARQAFVVSDCGRALQNNINALKKTGVIFADNKETETYNFVVQQFQDNNPYLVLNKRMLNKSKDADVLNDDKELIGQFGNSPDLLALINAKKTLFNEMLSRQGINTNMLNKSQYRSEMEIEGDTSHVELLLRQADDLRQKACEQMRKKFGIDIDVKNVYAEAGKESIQEDVGNERAKDDTRLQE